MEVTIKLPYNVGTPIYTVNNSEVKEFTVRNIEIVYKERENAFDETKVDISTEIIVTLSNGAPIKNNRIGVDYFLDKKELLDHIKNQL